MANVFPEPVDCLLGSIRLNEIDGDAEHDNDKDEFRLNLLAEARGNHAGHEKNDDQRIHEQVQQFKCEGAAAGRGGIVGAVFGEPGCRLLRSQANPGGRRSPKASGTDAEGMELIELWPQTLLLLDRAQIFRHILQPDVAKVPIIIDLVEDRTPDRHLPRTMGGRDIVSGDHAAHPGRSGTCRRFVERGW